MVIESLSLAIKPALPLEPQNMTGSSLIWPWPMRMVSWKRLRWCRLQLIPLPNQNKHPHSPIWAGGFAPPTKITSLSKHQFLWNLLKNCIRCGFANNIDNVAVLYTTSLSKNYQTHWNDLKKTKCVLKLLGWEDAKPILVAFVCLSSTVPWKI